MWCAWLFLSRYRGCGNLSSTTFTHTGYTGTELCNDPTRQLTTVLLTNRCYPVKTGNLGVNIEHARQNFNNAVLAAYTAVHGSEPAPVPVPYVADAHGTASS